MRCALIDSFGVLFSHPKDFTPVCTTELGYLAKLQSEFTTRNVLFIIGPDKLIKAFLVYPMSSGRNFDEVLRLIDSIQLTISHKVATPVNWKHGQDVISTGLRQ
jgi:alkyl hydroperoxide reductase subunit AhpC